MTTADIDQIIADYLHRLDVALSRLPESRRRQLVTEIDEHIKEARAELSDQSEASIRELLDRVGQPDDIAAEAGAPQASTWSRRADAWVPWLLLLGGFGFVVGWITGIGLLWSSTTWRVRDKLLGTFVLPGGLLPLAFLVTTPISTSSCTSHGGPGIPTVTHCTTSGFVLPPALGIILVAILLVAPIVTFIQLRRIGVDRS